MWVIERGEVVCVYFRVQGGRGLEHQRTGVKGKLAQLKEFSKSTASTFRRKQSTLSYSEDSVKLDKYLYYVHCRLHV